MLDSLIILTLLSAALFAHLWGGEPEQRGGQVYAVIVCLSLLRQTWSIKEFGQIDLP